MTPKGSLEETIPTIQPSSLQFLTLPTEIRLEVFTHCSAFTLLHLSHSSSQLYYEINKHASIINRSYGYCHSDPTKHRNKLNINDIARLETAGSSEEQSLKEWQLFRRLYYVPNANGLDWAACRFCCRLFPAQNFIFLGLDVYTVIAPCYRKLLEAYMRWNTPDRFAVEETLEVVEFLCDSCLYEEFPGLMAVE
ncbi:hypothetical protein BJ508DRAFT_326598 [Ascobolus immersus RN42]|uniref:F-box domain-containing protein n=1 Tax=Ascobolus immersus RN42 TaxID=1160509 RepID=A0A3N4I548_ASCIM|nr:hypothetical protein BJ508DRAFT_326598 [Ascobolus immersus RN42]